MKNAARQNQLSLPPLIIGFCIIVAMVKVIFQHPLWKNNTLPRRFVYDSTNCRNIYYPNRQNPWTYHWVGFVGDLSSQYLEK